MSGTEATYSVRERTGNPAHASVGDVVELVFDRAQHPRENHQDAHLDAVMATVVDRYGRTTVRTVIHRILVEDCPFRTATHGLEIHNLDGVRIGTTASRFLDELNTAHED